MTPPILQSALRARRLFYFVLTLLLTLLSCVITIRFVFDGGGDAFETLLLVALTFALAFQTRRWFRRFRGTSPEQ